MALGSSFEAKVRSAFIVALLVVAALTATTWKVAADSTEAGSSETRRARADWVRRTEPRWLVRLLSESHR